LVRYSLALVLFISLVSPTFAVSSLPVAGSETTVSASDHYVATSEQQLDKMLVVMRAFMRDQKNMRKALAVMQADNNFEAVAAAGYSAAKASAGDNKELNLALDNYRQYQTTLTHGGLGNADEADWDKMVAECKRLGELVKAAARSPLST
jgi:hypothetical protein